MSASITIPSRKGKEVMGSRPASSSAASSSSSSHAFPSTSASAAVASTHSPSKLPVSSSSSGEVPRDRRLSLLSASFSQQEHIVVNVGEPDGPARLITCVKASQGFDWNQDIFLPQDAERPDSSDLECRPDPVHEIVLTDADIESLIPE